jgi:1L-myo-inositol 1-phosphate cytidylyltransferase
VQAFLFWKAKTMQAVILAAGMGSRIQDLGSPKPLVMLNGKPLIEHVMERLCEAGVDRFVVVTGYDRQVLEPALDELATRRNWIIATAYNPDWQKSNGVSLLSASKLLAPQFLLTMSDHIVDPALTRIVLDAAKTDCRPVLGVDFDLSNPLVDMENVTRVQVDNSSVTRIGKGIDIYNGFDTGVFVGNRSLLDTLARLHADGSSPSLSDAVRAMADPIMAADVTGRMWVDVESIRAYQIVSQLTY